MKNTVLYIGGAAFLAYLFLKGAPTPGTVTAVTSVNYPYLLPGAPPPPATWDFNYYLQWEYPAMQKADPEILNSNHQLTASEAAQYKANYSDVRAWLSSVTQAGQPFAGNEMAAIQYHWTKGGIPDRRTFLPLLPPATGGLPPPPVNQNSSGSGSFLSSALAVASTVAMFLGPGDEKLNDYDCAVLINGAAIIKEILPMYYFVDDRALNIENKLTALLTQYTA